MLDPLKDKYHQLYKDMAVRASQESYAKRKQVGAVILSKTGLIALGWNALPSGYVHNCELEDGTIDPLVTHAEMNCLYKLAKEGVPTDGSILFVTLSPCLNCAKALAGVGVSAVYYKDHHREEALDHLRDMGIKVKQWEK